MAKVDGSSLLKGIEQWSEDVFLAAVDNMLNQLDDEVPRGESGDLAASRRLFDLGPLRVEIVYESEHASFTDEGTPPHVIEGNPLLAFEWGGHTVIVHSVQHPGTKGTQWWSGNMTDRDWALALRDAADRTTLR